MCMKYQTVMVRRLIAFLFALSLVVQLAFHKCYPSYKRYHQYQPVVWELLFHFSGICDCFQLWTALSSSSPCPLECSRLTEVFLSRGLSTWAASLLLHCSFCVLVLSRQPLRSRDFF